MPLPSALSNSSQAEIDAFTITTIIALCGNELKDDSPTSANFREYLQTASSENLAKYLTSCLQEKIEANGFILQDIVNELGRRLEYSVENGCYRGMKNKNGFDGLWKTPDEHSVLVEVKTTAVYSIDLDNVAAYLDKLINEGKASKKSSILFVVGRKDTEALEAQVRGSKHAWTTRIISTEALIKLVKLKENSKLETVERIHEILIPFEITKLDRMIEIAFDVAEDTKTALKEDEGEEPNSSSLQESLTPKKHDVTPSEVIAQFRSIMVESLVHEVGPLVKKSRALYWSSNKSIRAAFAFSKQYGDGKGYHYYWYGYHADWDKFLSEAEQGFFVLGCIGRNEAYVLPFAWIHSRVNSLSKTQTSAEDYHYQIYLESSGNEDMNIYFNNGQQESLRQFRRILAPPKD